MVIRRTRNFEKFNRPRPDLPVFSEEFEQWAPAGIPEKTRKSVEPLAGRDCRGCGMRGRVAQVLIRHLGEGPGVRAFSAGPVPIVAPPRLWTGPLCLVLHMLLAPGSLLPAPRSLPPTLSVRCFEWTRGEIMGGNRRLNRFFPGETRPRINPGFLKSVHSGLLLSSLTTAHRFPKFSSPGAIGHRGQHGRQWSWERAGGGGFVFWLASIKGPSPTAAPSCGGVIPIRHKFH